MDLRGPLRVGVGGPVGSGKTALVERLCKKMRDTYDIAVVTNDIYTKEDAEFLTRAGALAPERIVGVETGGCPHTAIREDASINLAAVADIVRKWPDLEAAHQRLNGEIALPVAVALAAATHGIALEAALEGYLHAFTANLISAAVRTVPLGQSDGQIALASLEGAVRRAVETALAVADLDEVGTATPLLDWCSLRHETQYTRLFRS